MMSPGLPDQFTATCVTRGLDPRGPSILRHNPIASSPRFFANKMDARVKPAHDSLMK
jgi:hypothetical protein